MKKVNALGIGQDVLELFDDLVVPQEVRHWFENTECVVFGLVDMDTKSKYQVQCFILYPFSIALFDRVED